VGVYTGTGVGDTITPDSVSAHVKAVPAGSRPSDAADSLYGLGGNDTLDSGGGADAVRGDGGNDQITFHGQGSNVRGGAGDDMIDYWPDANTVSGTAYGDDGQDQINLDLYDREVGAGTMVFHGGVGDDHLAGTGIDGSDFSGISVYAYGEEGNDRLDALKILTLSNVYPYTPANNDDHLFGGPGDDSYFVLEQRDVVVEQPNEGYDQVRVYDMDYAMTPNVEKLTVDSVADYNLAYRLDGNDLANVIEDANGNDTIYGHGGNDTIRGSSGNDYLDGGPGADILYGEVDNDRLTGGAGLDQLSGGPRNDIFDYNAVSESKPGAANRDVVLDFNGVGVPAGDQVDLSTIDANTTKAGNQAFAFKGTGAITGPGQVHVVASGGDTLIQANTGGTTAPELEILVKDGTATPSQWVAGDFIL
jgi:Ca2+-binding RTX toxin-like protein